MACACLFPITVIAGYALAYAVTFDLPVNQEAWIFDKWSLHGYEVNVGFV